MDWYVIQAFSNCEKKVKAAIEERIEISGLSEMFGEIMIPTEQVTELKKGQKKQLERKFFPGYMLVQMEMNDDTWHLVRKTPNVMGFLGGSKNKPVPLTERELNNIVNRVDEAVEKPKFKTVFESGETVRINDGPFNDFNGTVEEVDYEKNLIKVSVSIFGKSTPVEFKFFTSREELIWQKKLQQLLSYKFQLVEQTQVHL